MKLKNINFSNVLTNDPLPFSFELPQEKTNIPYIDRQYSILRERAEQYMRTPIPRLTYSDFISYWENGKRADYDDNYYNRRGRLLVFSLMAWMEPQDEKWLDAFCDTVWEILSLIHI